MARTAEITFKDFRRRYNTEDACRAELFSQWVSFSAWARMIEINL